jgi:hypothetical protein
MPTCSNAPGRWILLAALLAGSCGGEVLEGAAEDEVGMVALAVTNAPADAGCLRITAVGATTAVRSLGLRAGQNTTLMLGGLPVGRVTLTGEAHNAACGAVKADSVASWVSAAVTVMLAPGRPTMVALALSRPGQATVAVDFTDGGCGGAAACPAGSRCVNGACKRPISAPCANAGECESNACSNGLCVPPGGCVPGSCSGGAMCQGGICRFPNGAACMQPVQCLSGFCTVGRCSPPPAPPGAPCTVADQCQSRRCVMGRCQ